MNAGEDRKCWKSGLRRGSGKCSWSLYPDKKNVVLPKYEDERAQPRAHVRTTCSDSYLPSWPVGLDRLQCMGSIWWGGSLKKRKNGDHLFHHGWNSETALWNLMIRRWPPNHGWHLALSCHVLKCLNRIFWGTALQWMHLIHLTSFFFSSFYCCSLIFLEMAFHT